MLKRDELTNPKSCLNKAADDEPVFVLRAQDFTAPIVIREWLRINAGTIPFDKAEEARQLIAAMENWPNRKIPD